MCRTYSLIGRNTSSCLSVPGTRPLPILLGKHVAGTCVLLLASCSLGKHVTPDHRENTRGRASRLLLGLAHVFVLLLLLGNIR